MALLQTVDYKKRNIKIEGQSRLNRLDGRYLHIYTLNDGCSAACIFNDGLTDDTVDAAFIPRLTPFRPS